MGDGSPTNECPEAQGEDRHRVRGDPGGGQPEQGGQPGPEADPATVLQVGQANGSVEVGPKGIDVGGEPLQVDALPVSHPENERSLMAVL